MKKITLLMSISFALFMSTNSTAQVFTENFEDQGAGSRWLTVEEGIHNSSDFAAKYADLGIAAPENGGDYCMKLEVNNDATDPLGFSYLGAYPSGKTFTGSYTISFDSYNAFDADASGTTEVTVFGVGHDVELFDIIGQSFPSDGQSLALISDGSSSRDVRYYREGSALKAEDSDGSYIYGIDNSSQDIGSSPYVDAVTGGMTGNQWLKSSIEVTGTKVSFKINGVEFVSSTFVPTDAGNFILGIMDFYSSVNPAAYILIDNIVVTDASLAIDSSILEGVSVYPNPVKGELLNVEASKTAKISIVSTVGKLMYSGKAGAVNTQAWSKGVYVVVVEDAGKKASFKVLK